jgi:predicted esterase
MPGWVVGLFVGFANGTIMALKLIILDGIHGG